MAEPETAGETVWLTEDEQRMWRAWLASSARLMARLDTELQEQTGLAAGDYAVLVVLSEAPEGRLRMHDLATRTVVSRSLLTHRFSALSQRGLVAREECPTDKRGAFATLTAEGRAAIEAAAPKHVASVRRHFIDQLRAEEVATMAEALSRVAQRLGGSFGEGACAPLACPTEAAQPPA